MRPERIESTNADSSTNAPRETLINIADDFIIANSERPMRWASIRVQHGVHRNKVGHWKQVREVVDFFHARAAHRFAVNERVESEHAHPKTRARHSRQAAPDPPDPDESQRFAGQIAT
jgi:hypothetical protein